jgi:predicted fused transcriptional regulator/phosphomethylpyrimidine kinase
MNRRGFLGSLLGAPVVAALAEEPAASEGKYAAVESTWLPTSISTRVVTSNGDWGEEATVIIYGNDLAEITHDGAIFLKGID